MGLQLKQWGLAALVSAIFLFPLSLQGQKPELAEEDLRPVPAFEEWQEYCIDSNGPHGSSIDKADQRATCRCRWEGFPIDGDMTFDEFTASGLVCTNVRERVGFEEWIRRYIGQ